MLMNLLENKKIIQIASCTTVDFLTVETAILAIIR